MHNASNAGSPASLTRTDWDNLPLGENLSHLCGGTNKHPKGGHQSNVEQEIAKAEREDEEKKNRDGSGWRPSATAKEMLENLG